MRIMRFYHALHCKKSQLKAFESKGGGGRLTGGHLRPNEAKRPPFPPVGVREALTLRGGANGGAGAEAIAKRPAGPYISRVPISPALQFRPIEGLPQEHA